MLQKELEVNHAYDYSLYYVTALLEYFDLMLLDFKTHLPKGFPETLGTPLVCPCCLTATAQLNYFFWI